MRAVRVFLAGSILLRWVLGIALLVLLSGCGEGKTLTSPPPMIPVEVPKPSRYGAPLIDRPRDIANRSSAPCERLLTPTQLGQLGYPVVGQPSLIIDRAPSCTWTVDEPARSFSATVWIGEDYFVDTYRNRVLPIFRPTTLVGLPAVEQQSFSGPQICTTTVGIADGQSLDVQTDIGEFRSDGSPATDPCAEGRRVVEAIVSTLPPK